MFIYSVIRTNNSTTDEKKMKKKRADVHAPGAGNHLLPGIDLSVLCSARAENSGPWPFSGLRSIHLYAHAYIPPRH